MLKAISRRVGQNWKSGLTVALVSIPMSVSLAVASQATPLQGIITAIWAGFFAALFGGSHYNVTGPTGALSGILATFAIINGNESLAILAILSGLIILGAYFLKLERYLIFIPSSAIHGFTLGVAFIIAFNQLNFIFGLRNLPKHEHLVENIMESFAHMGAMSFPTVLVFASFLAGLFLFAKYIPKFPGVVVLTPIGLLVGYLSSQGKLPFDLQTLGSQYGDISTALISIPHGLNISRGIIGTAFTVALVAILETMLSAKIADEMTKTKHKKSKEMFGLAMANIASGLAGGMPATAALARTSLNIKSGANHKSSGAISGVLIAIVSLFFLPYFKYIPLAIIASFLVFIAIKMVEIHHFKRMYATDKLSVGLSFLVAFITVYEDPIIGILFGTAAALIVFAKNMSKGHFEIIINDLESKTHHRISDAHADKPIEASGETIVYSMKGQLAYFNASAHIQRFEKKLNGYKNVILRLRELHFVDIDGVDALNEIIEIIEKEGRNVFISGVEPRIDNLLSHSPRYQELKRQGKVFGKTTEALKNLGYAFSF